jgi:hypothetical protein
MTYEGWANYHTWNVALWISNDEPLYRKAYAFSERWPDMEGIYSVFIQGKLKNSLPAEYGALTSDGVSWTDPTLDHDALDEFMKGLAND